MIIDNSMIASTAHKAYLPVFSGVGPGTEVAIIDNVKLLLKKIQKTSERILLNLVRFALNKN